MTETTTGKGIIKVAILTNYLTQDFKAKYNDDDEALKMHIEKYGYDPNNFKDTEKLLTPKHIVMLETNERHTLESPVLADFAVAGSTRGFEDAVMKIKGSGLIVARYSTFYGGCSNYTGNTPEDGGYALDIPKKVEIVKAFLTNDSVLDALVAREMRRIETAVKKFNKGSERPVLITPYLKKALEVKK